VCTPSTPCWPNLRPALDARAARSSGSSGSRRSSSTGGGGGGGGPIDPAAAAPSVELSGALTSPERWQSALCAIAAPDCRAVRVRAMHCADAQAAEVASALLTNTSVLELEVSTAGPATADALAALLQVRNCAGRKHRR
jgi:hypothetical protein